jgi:hypothetical protein
MKVKCINNERRSNLLTIGIQYPVLQKYAIHYRIIDDQGNKTWFDYRLFEKVEEQMKQYQDTTMDNLAQVLEFNGAKVQGFAWNNYYLLNGVSIMWDDSMDCIQTIAVCMKKTDLDLFLIALERQGITLKPLPVDSLFDFKRYLLDSGLFKPDNKFSNMFLTYNIKTCYSNTLRIDVLEETKENADRLIEIAKLFKSVR